MIRKTRSRRGGFPLTGLLNRTKDAVSAAAGKTKAAVTTAAGQTRAAVTTRFNKTQKAAVCTKLRKLVEAGKAAQKKLDERKSDPAKKCRDPNVVAAPAAAMDMDGGRKSRRKGRKSRRRGTRKGVRRKTARRANKRKH